MTRNIGYYVHHHGAGHRMRAAIVADRTHGQITLLGTGLAATAGPHRYVDLPDDRIDDGSDATFDGDDCVARRPAALHYAPIDHDGVRRRVAAITDWIAAARPALMVVDVSCEIAMLARLASVATVYVRLGGCRDDVPHLQAFHAATALVSPFAAALDDPATPDWVRKKTFYCPGLVGRVAAGRVEPRSVLVVVGEGGLASEGDHWARAARATPDWAWRVIGPCSTTADRPGNLAILGWVDDAASHMATSDVIVGSAGDGVVSAVLAAGRPFLCIPEDRPFGEQRSKAARLVAAGAAVVCDHVATADWAALLAQAKSLVSHASAALDEPDGVGRLAAYLSDMAERESRP